MSFSYLKEDPKLRVLHMIKYKLPLLALMLLTVASVSADDYVDAVNRGNEALVIGDFQTALDNYHVAETDLPESPELNYNMGAALYGQQAYDDAVEKFTNALGSSEPGIAAAAHYNLGNVNFHKQDYPAAIENYQNALNLNPEDMDAKYNLELARKMLKDNANQEEQEDQEQQQQEEKSEEEKKQDEEQQKEGENEEQQEQQQQQGGESDEKEEKQQEQQAVGEEKKMSKEDAERILNALKNDEQEVQKKIKRAKATNTYKGKDW